MTILTCAFLSFSCSKLNDNLPDNCYTINVCLPGQQNCDNQKISFVADKKGQYKINVDNSLCPSSYWLKLQVMSDNNLAIDTVFTNFAQYEMLLSVDSGNHLNAEASVLQGQSNIQCAAVGKASVTICKVSE